MAKKYKKIIIPTPPQKKQIYNQIAKRTLIHHHAFPFYYPTNFIAPSFIKLYQSPHSLILNPLKNRHTQPNPNHPPNNFTFFKNLSQTTCIHMDRKYPYVLTTLILIFWKFLKWFSNTKNNKKHIRNNSKIIISKCSENNAKFQTNLFKKDNLFFDISSIFFLFTITYCLKNISFLFPQFQSKNFDQWNDCLKSKKDKMNLALNRKILKLLAIQEHFKMIKKFSPFLIKFSNSKLTLNAILPILSLCIPSTLCRTLIIQRKEYYFIHKEINLT